MKKRIVITGIGVCTSIGIGKKDFWENLKNGKSGVSKVSLFDSSNHLTHNAGEIKNLNIEKYLDKKYCKYMSRGARLAQISLKEAIEDAKIDKEDFKNNIASCFLGTTLGELQALEEMDRKWIKIGAESIDPKQVYQFLTPNMLLYGLYKYRFKGPSRIFTTACSAGNYAIAHGFDIIQCNEADFAIVGGADGFAWIPFTGFNQLRSVSPDKCRPFDKNRRGLIVGEGSGMLVLESLDRAISRKAKIYAEILGYGTSCDAFHVTRTQSSGIFDCMNDAIKQTGITNDSVDYICAHGTGTIQNDREETRAINQLFGEFSKKICVSSIKSMLGHTMGAASAIEAISCCLTVKNNIIPPTINYESFDPECNINYVTNNACSRIVNIALNNSFAFGGNNACLVIKKFNDEREE